MLLILWRHCGLKLANKSKFTFSKTYNIWKTLKVAKSVKFKFLFFLTALQIVAH